jgi:hypothetical protein
MAGIHDTRNAVHRGGRYAIAAAAGKRDRGARCAG